LPYTHRRCPLDVLQRVYPDQVGWFRYYGANPYDGPVRVRRPRRLYYFSHVEMSRRCFDMLRGGDTLPAADIARQAMTDKGLNYDADRHLRIEFTRRFTMQLNSMARKGDVQKIGSGRGVKWRLPS
jgi:hypothetical protein